MRDVMVLSARAEEVSFCKIDDKPCDLNIDCKDCSKEGNKYYYAREIERDDS